MDLVLDGPLHVAEGVQVLDLRPRAEGRLPPRRIETLASQRSDPSSMLQSETPA